MEATAWLKAESLGVQRQRSLRHRRELDSPSSLDLSKDAGALSLLERSAFGNRLRIRAGAPQIDEVHVPIRLLNDPGHVAAEEALPQIGPLASGEQGRIL